MGKVLVTYATKTGCTAGIAETIAAALAEEGLQVEVLPVKDAPSAEGFDAVVVGSGVRAGSWHPSAKAWVTANAPVLKNGRTAFFTCGLAMADGKADEARGYTDALIAETGVEPLDIGLFAGWFEPKEFGFLERNILKAMKAPAGDHRDMAAVAAWAKSVAPALAG